MEKGFCLILKALFVGYFYNLDPDTEPGPWTLEADPEKPGRRKTWNKYRIKKYV